MLETIKIFLLCIIEEYKLIFDQAIQSPSEYFYVWAIVTSIPLFSLLATTRLAKTKILFIFNFPGTVVHELLHFIIGFMTFARPASFSIIPKRVEDGWVLGSVGFNGINSLNAIPTSMAPLLAPAIVLLTLPVMTNYIAIMDNKELLGIIYGFSLVSVVSNSIPSGADFKILFEKPFGIIIYVFGVGWLVKNHLGI